mgnify:CR=1 FL=1
MSGDTSSTEQMLIHRTHDRILDDVGANTAVKTLTDNLCKSLIVITSVVRGDLLNIKNTYIDLN